MLPEITLSEIWDLLEIDMFAAAINYSYFCIPSLLIEEPLSLWLLNPCLEEWGLLFTAFSTYNYWTLANGFSLIFKSIGCYFWQLKSDTLAPSRTSSCFGTLGLKETWSSGFRFGTSDSSVSWAIYSWKWPDLLCLLKYGVIFSLDPLLFAVFAGDVQPLSGYPVLFSPYWSSFILLCGITRLFLSEFLSALFDWSVIRISLTMDGEALTCSTCERSKSFWLGDNRVLSIFWDWFGERIRPFLASYLVFP